jgi:hypothetical protein
MNTLCRDESLDAWTSARELFFVPMIFMGLVSEGGMAECFTTRRPDAGIGSDGIRERAVR